MTDQPTAPGLRELMAQARRWHMAFNSAKRSMTGEHQVACSGPDCEFCLFAASVMTRSPRKQLEERDTAALTPLQSAVDRLVGQVMTEGDENAMEARAALPPQPETDEQEQVIPVLPTTTESYYDPVPRTGEQGRHAYTLAMAQLKESRDQWKAEAESLRREWEAASSTLTPSPLIDVDAVIQAIAELPDRTSPDDWPEAMLVTADELRSILAAEASVLPISPQEKNDEEVARRDGHTLTDRREDSR